MEIDTIESNSSWPVDYSRIVDSVGEVSSPPKIKKNEIDTIAYKAASSVEYSGISLPSNAYAKTVLGRTKESLDLVRVPRKSQKNDKIPHQIALKRKESNCCYTCYPKKYHLQFVYEEKDDCIFHFDLTKRSYIIVTPKRHIETIYELEKDEMFDITHSINSFCKEHNILNYQIVTNMGSWKTHEHLHWKIKLDQELYYRLQEDHFSLLKLKKNYSQETQN